MAWCMVHAHCEQLIAHVEKDPLIVLGNKMGPHTVVSNTRHYHIVAGGVIKPHTILPGETSRGGQHTHATHCDSR